MTNLVQSSISLDDLIDLGHEISKASNVQGILFTLNKMLGANGGEIGYREEGKFKIVAQLGRAIRNNKFTNRPIMEETWAGEDVAIYLISDMNISEKIRNRYESIGINTVLRFKIYDSKFGKGLLLLYFKNEITLEPEVVRHLTALLNPILTNRVLLLKNAQTVERQEMAIRLMKSLASSFHPEGQLEAIIDFAQKRKATEGNLYAIDTDVMGDPVSIRNVSYWGDAIEDVDTSWLLKFIETYPRDEPYFISNMMEAPIEVDEELRQERSCLILPLRNEGVMVGIATIGWDKVIEISDSDWENYRAISKDASLFVYLIKTLVEAENNLLDLHTHLSKVVSTLSFAVFSTKGSKFDLFEKGTALKDLGGDSDLLEEEFDNVFAAYPKLRRYFQSTLDGKYVLKEVEMDGKFYLVEFNPDIEAGIVTGVTGSFLDITNNKQLVRRFLSTFNHELKQPMNNISGAIMSILEALNSLNDIFNSWQLRQDSDGNIVINQNDMLKLKKQLDRIGKWHHRAEVNVNMLIEMIAMLLENAKIQAGKIELAPRPIEIREWFKNLEDAYIGRMEDKKLEFKVIIAPEVPQHIIHDKDKFLYMVNNLVSNALKFTKVGGITIKVWSTGESNEIFHVSVIDTGIGVANENRQLIFEEFRQEDESTTRQFGGTGYGLYLVDTLTRLCGGGVDVESIQGVGSTFTIHLPIELKIQYKEEEE